MKAGVTEQKEEKETLLNPEGTNLEVLGERLIKFAEDGNLEDVTSLLTLKRNIDYHFKARAFLQAAINGHLPVVEVLLPALEDISHVYQSIKDNGFAEAASHFQTFLFSEKETLVGEALLAAAEKGRLNVVEVLSKRPEVDYSLFIATVKKAIYAGHLAVVQYLFNSIKGSFLYRQINLFSFDVFTAGHLPIIKYYFSLISPDNHEEMAGKGVFHYCTILENAAREGRLEEVRYYLTDHPNFFTYQNKVAAFRAAILESKFEIVKYLFEQGQITEEDKKNGFLEAVTCRASSQIIDFLLTHIQWSYWSSVRQSALQHAKETHRQSIIDLIEKNLAATTSVRATLSGLYFSVTSAGRSLLPTTAVAQEDSMDLEALAAETDAMEQGLSGPH